MSTRTAIAVAAHPDDIEFMMSGTLLLLREAGWEIHYLNLASGNCGSNECGGVKLRKIRTREAQEAARTLGAHWHRSLVDDLRIFYSEQLLLRLSAILREVQPSLVLTHSLQDYMEDHVNTARLAVSAAFSRGMRNFSTKPPRASYGGDVTVYHAQPHGLRDEMGRFVIPELFVDVSSVYTTKGHALAAHKSQQAWLQASQGNTSILGQMEEMCRVMGQLSKVFALAEGWRRHNHLGLCAADADPLHESLGGLVRRNPGYRRLLETDTI